MDEENEASDSLESSQGDLSDSSQHQIPRSTSFDHLVELAVDDAHTFHVYQSRLHDLIYRVLGTVSHQPTVRKNQLEDLFNDLCAKLALPLKAKLHNPSQLYYFELLSDFYSRELKLGNTILTVGSKSEFLWDSYQYEIICSLLLYKWLFFFPETQRRLLHKFIKNGHKLFSMDIENRMYTFQPIFDFLYFDILLSTKLWQTEEIREFLLDLFSLVCQFYFYYKPSNNQENINHFLKQTATQFQNGNIKSQLVAHPKIQTLNMFVNEIVRRLKILKEEKVIVHYLKRCEYFVGPLAIPGAKTSLRLHAILLDYATPGSPLYPTRAIRKQATRTMNIVFPMGRIPRTFVNYIFRFLHPIELGRSWLYWLTWFFGCLYMIWCVISKFFGSISNKCCCCCRKNKSPR